ncbi:cysteinyl-tRNA synthetase [Nematocida sp. LUAm3]|nr:cysteinyl-tRNA synthetase [Nematocida sp. LUAm3]KAI5176075.1 cysteinyl-tRNA synthetase [Nematocida sp. LUAm2]KAI5177119.1 cysteinyl-tRNA synthetase [Nematocida sp. LUAm1]
MTAERAPGGLKQKTKLRVYNTITKEKDEIKLEGSTLKWYTCGPTVYDLSHIGHARSYVLLDSIRKTLSRYFKYDIMYIMNITDIDDKIIIKAREEMAKAQSESIPQDKKNSFEWAQAYGLDVEEQRKIHYFTDKVSRTYEEEFFQSMGDLGVSLPTYTTRVSDYIQEIVLFIEKIEKEGYAYESGGSVYFDVRKHREKRKYPLMMCASQSKEEQQELLEEGEGKLMEGEKKSKEDFVLWKASKANEPAWLSKWGAGRPGWHIECSAMGANIAGGRLDMHSGGIDLMFPHHDNEIAQSEGAGLTDWVGHFIHTGHLHIDGRKMSKSLKNFITIQELLKIGTPREVRMMFLLQSYRGPMTYGEESLERAKTVEKKIFRYISLYAEEASTVTLPFSEKDSQMMKRFDEYMVEVDAALKDDFNYPKALTVIMDLISEGEKHGHRTINMHISQYIQEMMHAFGLESKIETSSSSGKALIDAIASFRNTIRTIAKEKGSAKEYFVACDDLRKTMAEMGILIEDSTSASAASIRKQI